MSPLEIWKSKNVTNLILEFYSANFEYRKVDTILAKNLVDLALGFKETKKVSLLKDINNIFKHVAKEAKILNQEIIPWELFDLSKVKVFLDYGANKLDSTNYVANHFANIEKIYAADVVPQSRDFEKPEKSNYIQLNKKEIPINGASIDFVNIQFVLHHVSSLSNIREIIGEIHRILRPGGEVLLWEETFEDRVDSKRLAQTNNNLGIATDIGLTEKFYKLSWQERKEFIVVNDWLINTNNTHLQWSMNYYQWEEWQALLESFRFSLIEKYNFGLRLNGRLKQGVHVVGRFVKI